MRADLAALHLAFRRAQELCVDLNTVSVGDAELQAIAGTALLAAQTAMRAVEAANHALERRAAERVARRCAPAVEVVARKKGRGVRMDVRRRRDPLAKDVCSCGHGSDDHVRDALSRETDAGQARRCTVCTCDAFDWSAEA